MKKREHEKQEKEWCEERDRSLILAEKPIKIPFSSTMQKTESLRVLKSTP